MMNNIFVIKYAVIDIKEIRSFHKDFIAARDMAIKIGQEDHVIEEWKFEETSPINVWSYDEQYQDWVRV
jgi:hypothetical protein